MRVSKILLAIIAPVLVATLDPSSASGCYAVVVGKEASADGSVMLGHNEQNGGNRIMNLRVVPRVRHRPGEAVKLLRGGTWPDVPETYSFIWSENPGLEFSDTYINEWGVAVASDGCRTREDSYSELVARGDIADGGIGYMLRRLIAERARTAREGVQIAGELLHRFGYSDSGRTLVIADPNEAWLLSIVRGKHWVAQRVPDDEVALLPNVHIISEIDLSDPGNFMGAPDIVDYAVRRGWYDPASGRPFSFRAAYNQSPQDEWDMRQWRGQYLVTGGTIQLAPAEQLPFSVKPDHKLTVKDVITILRYHGRGAICGAQTQEAAVFQLRSWLPPEIGCVYWRTSAEPCSGVLIPWYLGITETPGVYYKPVDIDEHLTLSFHFDPPAGTFDYDPESAWWTFKTLQDLVNRDYRVSAKVVRAVWDDFEARVFTRQSVVEKEALILFSKDRDSARLYLTGYSADLALQAVDMARELANELRTGTHAGVPHHCVVKAPEQTARAGDRTRVPIVIEGVAGSLTGEVGLKYDANILKAIGVKLPFPGGAYNRADISKEGEVRFAFGFTDAIDGQVNLILEFEVLPDTAGKRSPLILDSINLSEGLSVIRINGSVTVFPSEFSLLQNYPNPFNLGTWVPYHLRETASVSISIYSVTGELVRTLDIGQRDAGVHVSQSKAAYWDGRNDVGEEAASGIYYYTMQAGKFTAARRMMILK